MEKKGKMEAVRHSLAHLLASAVKEYDPKVKLGIGPVIENGFYYDFGFSEGKSPAQENLPKLEARMRKLAASSMPFIGREVSKDEAQKLFSDEEYKKELIEEFARERKTLTVYQSGDFTDLCRGGHVENTKEINLDAFALTHIAGAYWKGDEKNPMLTRIYGLAFETKEELVEYQKMLEEAKKRDHRKLGKELDLFTFDDDVGPGLPLWLPKGAIIAEELEGLAKRKE
ncbi:threonine--tRNA ligase, partial [bacterium]|nr:threonine--tRNA ligase [bacterium]